MAIITGGASGIGAATVRLFVENGARVVVADMQTGRGEALSRELSPNAVFQQTNVTHEEDVRAMVACAESSFGRIDCIFNNTGFGGALGGISETPAEEWDTTFDVLVRGVFLGMKYAAPFSAARAAASSLPQVSREWSRDTRLTLMQRRKPRKLLARTYMPHKARAFCIGPVFRADPTGLMQFLSSTLTGSRTTIDLVLD